MAKKKAKEEEKATSKKKPPADLDPNSREYHALYGWPKEKK